MSDVTRRVHVCISGPPMSRVVATCILALALIAPVHAKNAAGSNLSIQHPAYVAPPSGAPPSCSAAYTELDGNGDGTLDEGIAQGRKATDKEFAEHCIADNGGAWGYYLLARTLATQHKFAQAAIAAAAAQQVAPVYAVPSPKADDIALFRANALADAGDWAAADKIYDELIKKLCAARRAGGNEKPAPAP